MNEQPLILSLKPTYADLVFSGLKKAELRRRLSAQIADRDVFIYVSSPVKQLRGGFRVGRVWTGSPKDIWKMVSNLAGVSRSAFDDYYEGTTVAHALEIINVWEYAKPRSLDSLRKSFDGFVVPQSYRFAKLSESRSFRRMKIARSASTEIACPSEMADSRNVGLRRRSHQE